MFQVLAIIAFNDGKLNLSTFKTLQSIGPTVAVMNFWRLVGCYIGCLGVVLMFGAYTTARGMAISKLVIRSTSDSFYFQIYVLVLGIYAGVRGLFALLLLFPSCHRLSEIFDQSFFQNFK
ncbi:hypothetical protein CASFOL_039016 [Castilleja foliolosa]|uniref:Uncharacterized protein n=1 Tax=Castilleja foliolosa TaxID=1961234 RepID=A0ABD3BIL9_9LAMI